MSDQTGSPKKRPRKRPRTAARPAAAPTAIANWEERTTSRGIETISYSTKAPPRPTPSITNASFDSKFSPKSGPSDGNLHHPGNNYEDIDAHMNEPDQKPYRRGKVVLIK